MIPFRNTLRTGDQVWDVVRKRRGLVSAQPREKSVMVAVILDELTAAKSIYVGELRFIPPNANPPGTPENDPPIEGDLPAAPESYRQKKPAAARGPRQWAGASNSSPVQQLAERRVAIKVEMEEMTQRATALRSEDEKLEQAIKVLTA